MKIKAVDGVEGYSLEAMTTKWVELLNTLAIQARPRRTMEIPSSLGLPPRQTIPGGMAREDERQPLLSSDAARKRDGEESPVHDAFLNPPLEPENMDLYVVRSAILRAIRETLPLLHGFVLDVGCGRMPYKPLILTSASRVSRYVGLDLACNPYQKPDLEWDGKNIPLEDSSVDCALVTEVLEHTSDPEAILREIGRVLKPKGILFFTVPFLWPLHDVPCDEYRYTPFSLNRLLKMTGFENIQIQALGGWNASLAQMIGLWTRRSPLSDQNRSRYTTSLFPLFQELVTTDSLPQQFTENTMMSGLKGTAVKPDSRILLPGALTTDHHTNIIEPLTAIPSRATGSEIIVSERNSISSRKSEVPANSPDGALAIILPQVGAVSETFLTRQVQNLAPGRTVLLTRSVYPEADWLQCPVKILSSYSQGFSRFSTQIEKEVVQFLRSNRVTHLLVEYGCDGTEIVELNRRVLHLPIFVHFHGFDASMMLRRPEIVQYYRWMGSVVTGVIAVSRPMAERLVKVGIPPAKVHINHYGVEIPPQGLASPEHQPCRFISIMRLVPKKGPLHLLRAFHRALKVVPDIHLDVVGDGKLRGELEHYLAENHLQNSVQFHGALPNNVVRALLNSSCAYVQHSLTDPETGDAEGLPNTILEAAAAGLPIVSTRHEGIPEIVDQGGSGLLVAEGDIDGMSQQIICLAQNAELRKGMGQAARAKFEREFTVSRMITGLCCIMNLPLDWVSSSKELVSPAEQSRPVIITGGSCSSNNSCTEQNSIRQRQLLRGFECVQRGNWTAGLQYFDSALAVNPHHQGIQFSRAQCLLNLHRISEAVQALEAELSAQPGHPDALALLKQLKNSEGDEPGILQATKAKDGSGELCPRIPGEAPSAKNPPIESFSVDVQPVPSGDSMPWTGSPPPPFLSICIPTYNRASFLKESIESALSQSYPNYEVVIVDDGSTDETEQIIRSISSDKIRYIRKEHSGGPATRNRAVIEARGEFLVWLDSDDVLMSNTLAEHIAVLQKFPDHDVFYGDMLIADANLRPMRVDRYEDWHKRNSEMLAGMLTGDRIGNVGSMIRKSCYDRIGLYDLSFRRAHDYQWWSRLVKDAKFKHSGIVVAKWRWHENNMSSGTVKFDKSFEARIVQQMVEHYGLPELLPHLPWHRESRQEAESLAYLEIAKILLHWEDWWGAISFVRKSYDRLSSPATLRALHQLEGEVRTLRGIDSAQGTAHAYRQPLSEHEVSSPYCILGVSLETAVHNSPALTKTIDRIKKYLHIGKHELAAKIARKELGHLGEAADLPALISKSVTHSNRQKIAVQYLRGTGIEIGALHLPLPLPSEAKVQYVDRMPVDQLRCQYPELAHEKFVPVNIIDNGETLSSFEEGSCDFVIANHLIEHCQDPISALNHWLRVLRPDGILYLAFPDKDYTFDKEREATPLAHLIEDHEKGPAHSRWQHYLEWARHVNHTVGEKVEERARTLSDMDYSIHFHVWTTPEFLRFVQHCQTVLAFPFSRELSERNGAETILILRKLSPKEKSDGPEILGVSLPEIALGNAGMWNIAERVNRYLNSGKIALAQKIVKRELGNLPESGEILARILASCSSLPDHLGVEDGVSRHSPVANRPSDRGADPLRLMIVSHGFPPRAFAGTELYSYFLAKELQQRGHELRVLYPVFDPSLPDGSISEDFYDGLRVTCLNRNPQQPRDLTTLFRDPSVSTTLQPYISKLNLDLVHFQHLSGLSASTLEAFSGEHIPIAFTAHDGWLICEQCHFLQPLGQFCKDGPETVEKCVHCYMARNPQVPNDEYAAVSRVLSVRKEFLQRSITRIDTLIAPSQFIQRAYATHGFSPERIVLSPLGLYPFKKIPKLPAEGILRFSYIGNICHTKGFDLVVEAFNQFAGLRAHLNIHGKIENPEYFEMVFRKVRPNCSVVYHGSYRPADLPTIMATTDVAVIPSRCESFSIVARECLCGGVPVIGPNVGGVPEIIEDGVNGFLFQPGNANDLAEKLRLIFNNPQLVEKLRDGIKPVRTIAEDAAQLEVIYRHILEDKRDSTQSGQLSGSRRRASTHVTIGRSSIDDKSRTDRSPSKPPVLPRETHPLKIAVYSLEDPASCCAQLRLIQPHSKLIKSNGSEAASFEWAVSVRDRSYHIDRLAITKADLLIVQRSFPGPDTCSILELMQSTNKPIIYEIDDDLFSIPPTNPHHSYITERRPYMEECLRRATAVTVTTPSLRDALSTQNSNIHLLPNLISQEVWEFPCPRSSGPVVIGFFGTATHLEDLQMIEAALFKVAEKHEGNVAFTFMGCASEAVRRLPRFTMIDFEPCYEIYARKLQSTPIDIALVPLLDTPFNRCKSNIKWLEYSSCGVAGIFSNLTPYNTSIRHGKTGLLVENSPGDWFKAIDYLIRNPKKRKSIAQQARQQVMSEYTLATNWHLYSDVYRGLLKNQEDTTRRLSLNPPGISKLARDESSSYPVSDNSVESAAQDNPAVHWKLNTINNHVAQGNMPLAAKISQDELEHLPEARSLTEKLNAQSTLGPHETRMSDITRRHSQPPQQIQEQNSFLLSIIIPIHNQWEFTRKCLEALYSNTRNVLPFEVIVVDDASTDESGGKLKDLAPDHPNLRVLSSRQNQGFAKACNLGAEAANGRFLVFLNNDTEPLPNWLEAPIQRLEQDANIGVVGSKLLYPDRSIQHCGIEFCKTLNPEFPIWPLHRHLRAVEDDPAVNSVEEVQAVTGACLFISKALFEAVGGFSTEYRMYFEDIDLCLKVRQHGQRIFYEPQSVVIHYESKSSPNRETIDSLNIESARIFFAKWRSQFPTLGLPPCDPSHLTRCVPILDAIERNPELAKSCERMYRYLKMGKTSLAQGIFQKEFSHYPEAGSFFSKLSASASRWIPDCQSSTPLVKNIKKDGGNNGKCRPTVVWCAPLLNPSGYCSEALSFAVALRDLVDLELFNVGTIRSPGFVEGLPQNVKQVLQSKLRPQADVTGKVAIQHVPGNGLLRLPQASANIARTMFETDRIPPSWVACCNTMDEIWVPSQFNVETFAVSGVARHKLRVLPELVDEQEFNPGRHQPLPVPNRRGFNFLSVFEWSSRKGWDVLLSAYLREFSSKDDVCLYLKTYLMNEPDQDSLQIVWERIRARAEKLNLGGKSWPQIEVLDGQIPTKDLPRLYRAADCLVVPSRGEGWGRPHHEAMMMGLPVIATNWSANTEFMNQSNSYLLDFQLVQARNLEPSLQHYEGHRWAEPSEEHLRKLLREVYQRPDDAKARGMMARAHVLEKFSRRPVADRVLELIQALAFKKEGSDLTLLLAGLLTRHPSLESTVNRVDSYLGEGRSALAMKILQKELGHLPESNEILSRISRLSFTIEL